jgi:hypothetical protein
MAGGLTDDEDRYLLRVENRRNREAVEIALRELAEARAEGFARASEIIADVNAALAVKPLAPPEPVWPKIEAWLARLVRKR